MKMIEKKPYFVHESSCIDQPCTIGRDTKIWHFSHVMRDAEVGDSCNIGQNVVISSGCKVGNRVKIQNNVSVYTGVILEDDVFCGPSMVFTNVVNPRSHVSRKEAFRQTLVQRGATIGANATVVCGIRLGQYSFVGAGAVVTRDVPNHALVYGSPARLNGWVCRCGVKLDLSTLPDSIEQADCSACRQRYEKKALHVGEIGSQRTRG